MNAGRFDENSPIPLRPAFSLTCYSIGTPQLQPDGPRQWQKRAPPTFGLS
jgi:hypothetical protein